MPAEGMIATFDRRRALSREEVGFLTWDHPMVTGAMELLLGSETGNCAFAVLPTPNDRTMLLELMFVLETIAAPQLHADRFLPPTPIRVVVNHKCVDVTETFGDPEPRLTKGSPFKLLENADIVRRVLPAMLHAAEKLVESRATVLRQAAASEMHLLIGHEVHRLQTLAQVNDHVRPQEIQLAIAQQEKLADTLQTSRLRLDSLRLIWQGPPAKLA
jgi:ATP-dependent helicase HepA